jgi:predicted MFS family arabinose efflux permease
MPISSERIFPIILAIAAGMTFSPSIGGWWNGIFGWRSLYLVLSILCTLLFIFCSSSKVLNIVPLKAIDGPDPELKNAGNTARFIYSFSFLTGLFHSGVFVWISHYFTSRYRLDEFEIATELFIFGSPGFVISFLIHHFKIDSKTITILYVSMGLTILGLVFLWGELPLKSAECLLAIISIGFGCSQPLFVGLLKLPQGRESLLPPAAHGIASLFGGYGFGPLVMFALLSIDLSTGLIFLIATVAGLAYLSHRVWKKSDSPARLAN